MSQPPAPPWPQARRYFLARLLRVPARHLASVATVDDRYVPHCVCGWQGASHGHRGGAFAEAHVHTRHVQTHVEEPGEGLAAGDRDLEAANTTPGQLVLLPKQPPRSDPRAARRTW
jgi:hypothetical protein